MLGRTLSLLFGFAVAVSLSGCAGYDVELQGGIFEAAGLTNLNKKPTEPEMANRPGIVVPPSTESLPKPGEAKPVVAAVNGEAFPVNPEDAKKLKKSELIAKHEAFCVKARERFEQGMTTVIERSPWGECHESILKSVMGISAWGNKNVGSE